MRLLIIFTFLITICFQKLQAKNLVLKNLQIFLFLIFSTVLVKAQNLVPNFSFEQHDTCPQTADRIQYAIGWSKYSGNFPYVTTPDYYNACSADSLMGVPQSFSCFQQDHRNCGAFAGLSTYCTCGIDYREQIGIQLSSPLILGQKYFLSFYTALGEYWLGANLSGMPSNNIGLRLSTVPYNPSNPVPIDNFSHLRSSTIITDSTNWQRISGSIIADSAYQYLILGNFYDDSNTDTIQYSCAACINYGSFYLVDDICVSIDSVLANGGIDTLPCITFVNELANDEGLHIFPNPTASTLKCEFPHSMNAKIELYDVYGNKLRVISIKNSSNYELDLTYVNSGCYFLILTSISGNKYFTKKIIKL